MVRFVLNGDEVTINFTEKYPHKMEYKDPNGKDREMVFYADQIHILTPDAYQDLMKLSWLPRHIRSLWKKLTYRWVRV